MLILAIDTSAVASAALVSDGATESRLGSFATEDTRSHAEVLAPGIERLLAEAGLAGADVDAIVTGVGPGPFTGLRSGIVTARTLAFVWNKPLYGVMSLDAIALDVARSAEAPPEFLVATDARRKEVYWARYTLTGARLPRLLDGPHVGFAADLPGLPVYGAGAGIYSGVLHAVPGFSDRQPEALGLGRLALARLAAGEQLLDSTPLYLRESDAQVPGPRKRAL
ncbi:tRNA (adenosine(37)-N6)-threonylcarbamoyltransferase complex dimerization subunit type 1 TsaB [Arthrobacter sp. PAMC25564]|uniref:tRNA (adenosine(37)-N6)-threonylcarbamoyltransferase complex dimerization subunit type 1 TsaB n=1 Tax=Arthrobacter sp. PAMC25564 TaxID=2565366 RepID=UPI0010A29F34|nr:tRNA (adenosine(37)-N6)-threonylcarbamoyltransferase complex dimerization subunit type 1 TsaB [Arthrobacter sp. PAMC25564]QCB96778.1 tRNA (adenosine(37)-N6)-threonylcarbamoyltransferase complex dimerization subunit type 1 TsaB [Arthrobacter sp. PAMC25564]